MADVGMRYEDAKVRIKRMTSNNHGDARLKVNLCNSMLNQVRMREGERAARELTRECSGR